MLKRLKQYIDFKGVSVSAFEKSIGMSNASFGKSLKNKGTIGADKLEIILKIYPDINLYWLVTGKGEMILENPENNIKRDPPVEEKCCNCEIQEERIKEKDETIADLRASIADKNEIIRLLKKKASHQDNPEANKKRA